MRTTIWRAVARYPERPFTVAALFLACLVVSSTSAAPGSARLPVVPKWHRFDQAFKSSVVYSNPLQDATLTARFISPLGDTYTVPGFWDGGRTWRVRFAPDQPGQWRFETSCSDTSNGGLHAQTGSFLCAAALGGGRFDLHGPVRVARDHRHFEHADHTPFFWLADTVWNGARVSEPKEWDLYAQVRASQRFTVAQWTAAPGNDFKQESALTGFPDQVGIDPEVYRRLDAKIETLSHAGILSAIAPLVELQTNTPTLKDDQAALVVGYALARWDAYPVIWLLPVGGADSANSTARWKHVGETVFRQHHHAPILLYAATDPSSLRDFEQEDGVAGFGMESLNSAAARFGTNEPAHPVIAFTPYENAPDSQRRVTADQVRQAAYLGLLGVPAAGVSYGASGVVSWDRSRDDKVSSADLPLWHRALFMPAAKQLSKLDRFFSSIPFWRLRPQPGAIAKQSAESASSPTLVAAGTEGKDLLLVYVPQERTLELFVEAMPASPIVTWFNPRTGDTSPAVAVVVGRTCQFPTPEPGDWLLVLKAGK